MIHELQCPVSLRTTLGRQQVQSEDRPARQRQRGRSRSCPPAAPAQAVLRPGAPCRAPLEGAAGSRGRQASADVNPGDKKVWSARVQFTSPTPPRR